MKYVREARLRKGAAGFTLVEMAIVSGLFAVALGSLALFFRGTERLYRAETLDAELERQAAHALERVVRELRIAAADSFAPAPEDGELSSFQYVQAVGITAGAVDWTTPRLLELSLEAGEIDDGLDDNGNGLVDEGRLVLTTDVDGPEERSLLITRWVREFLEGEVENGLDDNGNGLVDEPGFVVDAFGDALRIRLTLERRTDEGRFLTHTVQTSIRPRNRVEPEVE